MAPKQIKETGMIEPEIPITDPKHKFYQDCVAASKNGNKMCAPPYTAEVFEDVGRAFCIGLLDFF